MFVKGITWDFFEYLTEIVWVIKSSFIGYFLDSIAYLFRNASPFLRHFMKPA